MAAATIAVALVMAAAVEKLAVATVMAAAVALVAVGRARATEMAKVAAASKGGDRAEVGELAAARVAARARPG